MSSGERDIILIAHNLRSCHNVGSLLRTAEGLGVIQVYLTGYTPFPLSQDETRLPHIAHKVSHDIHKTALGAEEFVSWHHSQTITNILAKLKQEGFTIAALEQSKSSIKLPQFKQPGKIVIVVGREAEGLETEVLAACDMTLEIPMLGRKESFNVVQAAAMALYHCRFV